MHERARRRDRGGTPIEPESFEAAGAELIEERPPRRLVIECPAFDRRDPDARGRPERQRLGVRGDDDLAGLQDGDFVSQRLQSIGPSIFGRGEFTGGQIEQRGPGCGVAGIAAARRRDRQQKRRLARVEIACVGQRAWRDDADDLALDDAFRLPRIFDLIADGDAEPFPDQARDVAVDGVERHAAHRNPAAVRILGSGGQRELERARGDERVLVEHLVEVAHPEKEDRIAMLLLGIEILSHRRRDRR